MPVIDSSVYASVIVKDEFYEECRKYMITNKSTLDLAFAEVGNVLWKHVKMGRIKAEEVVKRAEMLKKLINTSRVYKTENYLTEAVELAVKYDITVYDALFITLALNLNEKLWNRLKDTELSNAIECIR